MPFLSKNLRYFMAVAKHASITKAADFLCITPSPLSKNIQMLEAAIGFPLFNRDKHGLHLTEKGVLLHQKLTPSYNDILAIEQDLRIVQPNELNRLAIGTNGTYSGFIPDLYNQIKLKNRGFSLSMHIVDDRDMVKALEEGIIQLYISSGGCVTGKNIMAHPMGSERLQLAISPHLLDKYDNNLNVIMSSYPWVQAQRTYFQFNSVLLPYLRARGISPNVVCFNDLSMRLSLVEREQAISMISQSVRNEIAQRNIRLISPPGKVLYLNRYVYSLKENSEVLDEPISLLLKCFKEHITKCSEESDELQREY